ncbi:MAG: hypothetical protein A2V66_04235 [Ignavibacteria bacterium RBG_13_36_8]|nr:MAG: hypothetical protein A2V66_04235 [Ignavibacteria bacterium RBG_13_36_8]
MVKYTLTKLLSKRNMKTKIAYIFLFFLICSIIYSQDCVFTLYINSNRTDAAIYINNKLVGTGSTEVTLEIGKHQIRLKESERRWGAQLITDTVEILDCDITKYLNYNFENEMYLDSYPQDAAVTKNDDVIGYTPLSLFPQKGLYELSKSNFESKLIELTEISSVNPIQLNFTGEINKTNFVESVWFKVMLGSAVAFGATAAHFKIQADKKYDQYLETNDRKYLDETNKYDLYSGIAFGALQVNFGVLIYILFME